MPGKSRKERKSVKVQKASKNNTRKNKVQKKNMKKQTKNMKKQKGKSMKKLLKKNMKKQMKKTLKGGSGPLKRRISAPADLESSAKKPKTMQPPTNNNLLPQPNTKRQRIQSNNPPPPPQAVNVESLQLGPAAFTVGKTQKKSTRRTASQKRDARRKRDVSRKQRTTLSRAQSLESNTEIQQLERFLGSHSEIMEIKFQRIARKLREILSFVTFDKNKLDKIITLLLSSNVASFCSIGQEVAILNAVRVGAEIPDFIDENDLVNRLRELLVGPHAPGAIANDKAAAEERPVRLPGPVARRATFDVVPDITEERLNFLMHAQKERIKEILKKREQDAEKEKQIEDVTILQESYESIEALGTRPSVKTLVGTVRPIASHVNLVFRQKRGEIYEVINNKVEEIIEGLPEQVEQIKNEVKTIIDALIKYILNQALKVEEIRMITAYGIVLYRHGFTIISEGIDASIRTGSARIISGIRFLRMFVRNTAEDTVEHVIGKITREIIEMKQETEENARKELAVARISVHNDEINRSLIAKLEQLLSNPNLFLEKATETTVFGLSYPNIGLLHSFIQYSQESNTNVRALTLGGLSTSMSNGTSILTGVIEACVMPELSMIRFTRNEQYKYNFCNAMMAGVPNVVILRPDPDARALAEIVSHVFLNPEFVTFIDSNKQKFMGFLNSLTMSLLTKPKNYDVLLEELKKIVKILLGSTSQIDRSIPVNNLAAIYINTEICKDLLKNLVMKINQTNAFINYNDDPTTFVVAEERQPVQEAVRLNNNDFTGLAQTHVFGPWRIVLNTLNKLEILSKRFKTFILHRHGLIADTREVAAHENARVVVEEVEVGEVGEVEEMQREFNDDAGTAHAFAMPAQNAPPPPPPPTSASSASASSSSMGTSVPPDNNNNNDEDPLEHARNVSMDTMELADYIRKTIEQEDIIFGTEKNTEKNTENNTENN